MSTRLLFLTVFALLTLAHSGCSDRAAQEHDGAHAEMEPTGPTNRVEIPAVVRSNLGITFATVERRHVSRTLRVPGRFELLPTARREYRMTLPGHVEVFVDQYDSVEQNQPLFRFRSQQWAALLGEIAAAEQTVAQAAAQMRVADASARENRNRLEILQSRIAALSAAEIRRADLELQAAEVEASLERMEAQRDLAAAQLRSARQLSEQTIARAAAVLNIPRQALLDNGADSPLIARALDAVTVHSLKSGIVETIAVTNGSYADETALVMTIVDPARLRFRASVVQGDVRHIGSLAPTVIVPAQTSGAEMAEGVEATLTIGLEASSQQRTIEVVAQPQEHRTWMRPGVSAFLEITLDGTDRAELAIPRSALMKDGLKHVFFRRDPSDPNAAIRIEADLGPDDGRWVVIRSGLRLGDEVVLAGAYELMLATAQSGGGMQGGHFHPDGTWHADH